MLDMKHRFYTEIVWDWLVMYGTQQLPAKEWADLLHIKIIDPDGWRGKNGRPLEDKISLTEFMQRIYQCTIMPVR